MDVLHDTIDSLSLGGPFGPVQTPSLTINAGDSLTVLGQVGILAGVLGTGPATLANNGTLTVDGVMNAGGPVTNSGVFIYSGTSFQKQAPMTNTAGAFFINKGTTHFTSIFGTFNNAGTVINAAGASFSTHGDLITNSAGASFINFGSFNPDSDTTFNNSGSIINGGTYSLTSSNLNNISNAGTFSNSGTVTIDSFSSITTSTNYTQTAGSTIVDGKITTNAGAIVDIRGGTLSGTGTIGGNVLMGGTLMPGDAPGLLPFWETTSSHVPEFLMS